MIERPLKPEDIKEFKLRNNIYLNDDREYLCAGQSHPYGFVGAAWDLYYNNNPKLNVKAIENEGYILTEITFRKGEHSLLMHDYFNKKDGKLYRDIVPNDFEYSYTVYLGLIQYLNQFASCFKVKKCLRLNFDKYVSYRMCCIGDELLNIPEKKERYNYLTNKLEGHCVKKNDLEIPKFSKKEVQKIEDDIELKNKCDIRIYKYYFALYEDLETKANVQLLKITEKYLLDKNFYSDLLNSLKSKNYTILSKYIAIFYKHDYNIPLYHFCLFFQEKLVYFLKSTFSDFTEFSINPNLQLNLGKIELVELLEALKKTGRITGCSKDELYRYFCNAFNYDYENVKNHSTLSSSKVKPKYTDPNSRSRFLQSLMKELEAEFKS